MNGNLSSNAAGYTDKVKIGIDVAASEFFEDGKYDLDWKTKNNDKSHVKTADEFAAVFKEYVRGKYLLTYC